MKPLHTLVAACLVALSASAATIELPADLIQDKIRGGLLGQILGDLNGLKHEFKYIAEPGNVESYTPGLPDGAWTDDDTDFEWVYIVAAEQRGAAIIPSKEIPELWRRHINRKFWCANQYARQLMDLGMVPPLTGSVHFNPWSEFNIAGQFCSETWGLVSPGMPQTAARTGLNYTQVAIDGEPAQTTQLFDAMIATAFLTNDVQRIIDAGAAAVDERSVIRQLVTDVRNWHRANPDDWRATRLALKKKYSRFNGTMRDMNGYELNTASIIAAILYGGGEFVPTAIAAFNFGWDADCNAATACTVAGVLKGARWMEAQGWEIKDVYRNTTRDDMPKDETITRFGDRLITIAERAIEQNGGSKFSRDGKDWYRISAEAPGNVKKLADPARELAELAKSLKPEIEAAVMRMPSMQAAARAAYQAICLGLADDLRREHGAEWLQALAALETFPKVVAVLFFESPTPAGRALRKRALAAGLSEPPKKIKIW